MPLPGILFQDGIWGRLRSDYLLGKSPAAAVAEYRTLMVVSINVSCGSNCDDGSEGGVANKSRPWYSNFVV